MSSKRYPEEIKVEAVRQVSERGHSVAEVASSPGMTTHSLYAWEKKYGPASAGHQSKTADELGIRRLKKELNRVTDERDILKKAAGDSIIRRGNCYPRASSNCSNANASSAWCTRRAMKDALTSSTISKFFTTTSDGIVSITSYCQ